MKNNFYNPNPYEVLGVSQSVSNTEITKAFTKAMKEKKYPVDVIAQARKTLMNTEERIMADYLRPNLPMIKRFKRQDISDLQETAINLEFSPEFDGLHEDLTRINQVSETDKRLGLTFLGKLDLT